MAGYVFFSDEHIQFIQLFLGKGDLLAPSAGTDKRLCRSKDRLV